MLRKAALTAIVVISLAASCGSTLAWASNAPLSRLIT